MTTVFFIRHAQSDYTIRDERTRPLTKKGLLDRTLVTDFFRDHPIDCVYSSPYQRAIDTIADYAKQHDLKIEIIEDFREHTSGCDRLCDTAFSSMLQRHWADFSFSLPNGESLAAVRKRNIDALNKIIAKHTGNVIGIGTHGTALSTIINHYDPTYGLEDYKAIADIMPWIVRMDFHGTGCIGMEKIDLFHLGQTPDYSNCVVRTADLGALGAYRYTVIFARYKDKWLYCRAKSRDVFETPGGHIEPGESPLDCAKRELYEETGAIEFEIIPAFDYSVHVSTGYSNGQVFIATIGELGDLPDYEMAEVLRFDTIPDHMRFPNILPVLFAKAQALL